MPKYPMTIRLEKTRVCQACGKKGHTEFAHILGRGRRGELANDESMIIELCDHCHNNESDPDIMEDIALHMIDQHPNWLEHCLIWARRIGTKPNWVQLCMEMMDERQTAS